MAGRWNGWSSAACVHIAYFWILLHRTYLQSWWQSSCRTRSYGQGKRFKFTKGKTQLHKCIAFLPVHLSCWDEILLRSSVARSWVFSSFFSQASLESKLDPLFDDVFFRLCSLNPCLASWRISSHSDFRFLVLSEPTISKDVLGTSKDLSMIKQLHIRITLLVLALTHTRSY